MKYSLTVLSNTFFISVKGLIAGKMSYDDSEEISKRPFLSNIRIRMALNRIKRRNKHLIRFMKFNGSDFLGS